MKFFQEKRLREKELREELETEKLRFMESSKLATRAIRNDLAFGNWGNWLKAHPVESMALIAIVGFTAGYSFGQSRAEQSLTFHPMSTSLEP